MGANLWDNRDSDRSTVDKLILPGYTVDDAKLTLEQLIQKEGLNAERHTVITEDGYHLSVFHI